MKFVNSAAFLLHASAASNPPTAAPGSPVGRVVTLLTELKQRLNTDNTNEQAVFDKYACWCEETTSRKAQAIEANRAEIGRLGQEILTQKALVAEKTLEAQQTLAEIQANEEAQEQATSIRQKENAAYAAEVAELQSAVGALEKAVHVLRDATAPALVQQQREGVIGAAALRQAEAALADAQAALAVVPETMLARHAGTASKLQLLSSHAASLAKVGSQRAKYTPQSLTVQGILGDLYDTFTKDLEGHHSDEAQKSTAYENLIATKQQEVHLLHEKIQKAVKVKVEAETMLAEALQSYDDTGAQLQDDVAFFDTTKGACESKTNAWATRKGLRTEQLAGIAQALTILTSDEARTLFDKAITPGVGMFLQVSSSAFGPAQHAAQALRRQAAKAHSLRLIAVAANLQFTQGGHFDEAISAIDTMVGVLKQEAANDLTKRDECVNNLHNIESNISEINWNIEVNDAEITKIGDSITDLEGLETQATQDIQLVQQQIIDLTSNRTQENSDFKAAKADDLKAIDLLQQAKDALAAYYANHSIDLGSTEGGRAFLQLEVANSSAPNRSEVLYTKDDAPDAEFSHKGKGKQETKGVIAILETIIEDLNTEVANAVKAEEDAQLEYEAQKKAAEKLEGSLVAKKANIVTDLAQRRTDKTNEETDKGNNEADLGVQTGLKASTEPDCTKIANKFEDRQSKRQLELDGLRQAKEFLAGYRVSQGDGSDLPGAASAALLTKKTQQKVAAGGGAHLRGLKAPARGQAVRRHA